MCVSSEQGKLSCTGKGIQFILQYLKREFVCSLNKLSICDIFIFSKKKCIINTSVVIVQNFIENKNLTERP